MKTASAFQVSDQHVVCTSHLSRCTPSFILLELIYLKIFCEVTKYLTFTILFSLNYKHQPYYSSLDTLTVVWKWQLNPCLVFKRKIIICPRWIAWVCNGSTAVHSLAKVWSFVWKSTKIHKITCLGSFKHSASVQTIWTCNSGQVSANSRTCIQGDIICYLQRSNLSPFYSNRCSIFYKICNQQTTWKKVNFHQFANKNSVI